MSRHADISPLGLALDHHAAHGWRRLQGRRRARRLAHSTDWADAADVGATAAAADAAAVDRAARCRRSLRPHPAREQELRRRRCRRRQQHRVRPESAVHHARKRSAVRDDCDAAADQRAQQRGLPRPCHGRSAQLGCTDWQHDFFHHPRSARQQTQRSDRLHRRVVCRRFRLAVSAEKPRGSSSSRRSARRRWCAPWSRWPYPGST